MGDSINLPFPFQQQGGVNDQAALPPSPALPPSNPLTDPQGAELNKKNSLNTPLDEHINRLLLQSPSQFKKQRMAEIFGETDDKGQPGGMNKKGIAGRLLLSILGGAQPLQDRLMQEYQLQHSQLSTAVQAQHNQMQMQQAQGMMNFRMQKMQQDASIAEAKNTTNLLKAQLTSKYQTNLNDIREQARRDKWSSTRLANEEKQLNIDYLERSDHLAGEDGKLQAITSRMQDPDPQVAARGQQELQNWKFNLDYRARDYLFSHGTGTQRSTTVGPQDASGAVTTTSTTQKLTPPNNPLLGQGAGIVGPAMGAPQGGAGQIGQPPPQGQPQQPQQQTSPPPQQTYAQSAPLAASQTQSLMGGRQIPPAMDDSQQAPVAPQQQISPQPGKAQINPGAAPSPISSSKLQQPTIQAKTANVLDDIRGRNELAKWKTADYWIKQITQPNISTTAYSKLWSDMASGGDKYLPRIVKQRLADLDVDLNMLDPGVKTQQVIAAQVEQHIPKIVNLIDSLDKQGKLGVIMGRFNEFMAGKVGAGDPEFAKLRLNMGMLDSATVRAHFGGRGGQLFLTHFKDLLNQKGATADQMKAQLSGLQDWMHTYANPNDLRTAAKNPDAVAASTGQTEKATTTGKPKTADEFLKSIGR